MQSKSKPDREAEYRALADFRYHIRRYLDFSDQAAKKAGIESKQYQLLLAIRGLPEEIEPTVGTLAQRLGLRHHSSVELINRAEANQLVKRSRNGARVLVKLTDKGQRVLPDRLDHFARWDLSPHGRRLSSPELHSMLVSSGCARFPHG